MTQNFSSQEFPAPFLRRDIWNKTQIRVPISIDLSITPHTLVLGSTGSGKTTAIRSFVAHILYTPAYEGAQLIVCDYKGLDYNFLVGQDRYFAHDTYRDGIELFKKTLDSRIREQNKIMNPILLVMDEWNNFITDLSKKEADEYIKLLSYSLNMGRAYQMYVICGAQTAHVDWFGKSRDSFSTVIGLGQLSKEAASMMFSDYKEKIVPCPRGCGYLLQDGFSLKEILVPRVRNMKKLEKVLIDGISR